MKRKEPTIKPEIPKILKPPKIPIVKIRIPKIMPIPTMPMPIPTMPFPVPHILPFKKQKEFTPKEEAFIEKILKEIENNKQVEIVLKKPEMFDGFELVHEKV